MQGLAHKVGLSFNERVFEEKPVSKLTVLCRYTVAVAIKRVVSRGLLLGCCVLFSVITKLPLRRQRNAGRSVTIRRGTATTGQIVLDLSCSVAFKNLFSLFVVDFEPDC
jgi:hypothetical protein